MQRAIRAESLLKYACVLLALCRWLWQAYLRPAWTPASHRQFPPRFQQAVRTLLLAAHRAVHQPGRSTAAALGALPQDVLLHIIDAAARPASAWM